jgi:hypothetical protein
VDEEYSELDDADFDLLFVVKVDDKEFKRCRKEAMDFEMNQWKHNLTTITRR